MLQGLTESIGRRHLAGFAVGLGVAGLLIACGGGSQTAGAGSSSAQPAGGGGANSTPVTTKGTVTLTGAVSGTAMFSNTLTFGHPSDCTGCATSCAETVMPNSSGFYVFPKDTVTIAGHADSISAQLDTGKYHGAGTYQGADFGDDSSDHFGLDVASDQDPFQPPTTGTQHLTVNSDGSGSYTFMGWKDVGGRAESGTVMWTCAS